MPKDNPQAYLKGKTKSKKAKQGRVTTIDTMADAISSMRPKEAQLGSVNQQILSRGRQQFLQNTPRNIGDSVNVPEQANAEPLVGPAGPTLPTPAAPQASAATGGAAQATPAKVTISSDNAGVAVSVDNIKIGGNQAQNAAPQAQANAAPQSAVARSQLVFPRRQLPPINFDEGGVIIQDRDFMRQALESTRPKSGWSY